MPQDLTKLRARKTYPDTRRTFALKSWRMWQSKAVASQQFGQEIWRNSLNWRFSEIFHQHDQHKKSYTHCMGFRRHLIPGIRLVPWGRRGIMAPSYVLAIDQGTTSTRAILFDKDGQAWQRDLFTTFSQGLRIEVSWSLVLKSCLEVYLEST